MTDEFCLVTAAMDDREFAYRLAKRLVDSKLAACVQVTPIGSTYRWKGKINVADEYLLTIKTNWPGFISPWKKPSGRDIPMNSLRSCVCPSMADFIRTSIGSRNALNNLYPL